MIFNAKICFSSIFLGKIIYFLVDQQPCKIPRKEVFFPLFCSKYATFRIKSSKNEPKMAHFLRFYAIFLEFRAEIPYPTSWKNIYFFMKSSWFMPISAQNEAFWAIFCSKLPIFLWKVANFDLFLSMGGRQKYINFLHKSSNFYQFMPEILDFLSKYGQIGHIFSENQRFLVIFVGLPSTIFAPNSVFSGHFLTI